MRLKLNWGRLYSEHTQESVEETEDETLYYHPSGSKWEVIPKFAKPWIRLI